MNLIKQLRGAYWDQFLKNREQVCLTFDGNLQLWSPRNNASTRSTFIKGYKDPKIFKWMNRFLRPGMEVLDVGANIGTYALFIAKRIGPTGRLIAVEPDPINLTYLCRNALENGLHQVTIEAVAAGDHVGEVELLVCSTNCGEHRVATTNDSAGSRKTVPMVGLDAVVSRNGFTHVDFVKMDIEGFEFWALKGLQETLRKHSPVLLIEHSIETTEHYGISMEETQRLLRDANYRPYALTRRGLVPYAFSRKHGDALWSKTALC